MKAGKWREKRLAYQTTLEEYIIVAQERLEVTVFRRADHWNPEVLSRLEQNLTLNSVSLSLP